MQVNIAQGPTQTAMAAIATAVTPVVMISANAILIGTIGSKHQAMSDRVRLLAAEWRSTEVSASRRDSIRAQVYLFNLRVAWISRSHFLLYVATACFITMVLVIGLGPVVNSGPVLALFSLPLLLGGVLLMLTAIFLELLDLRRARATLRLESADVSSDAAGLREI